MQQNIAYELGDIVQVISPLGQRLLAPEAS